MNFKHYNQRQATFLPYSFYDFIFKEHPVRVVDQVTAAAGIFRVAINIKTPLLTHYQRR